MASSSAWCGRGVLDRSGKLGVDEQRRARSPQRGQGGGQAVFIEMAKLRDAGVDEKALEAERPFVEQVPQHGVVSRHRASPQADIDAALAVHRLRLRQERGHRGRRRNGVERHIDDRRHSARGRGPGGRLEALPLRPPRLVHVDVRVDHPRQEHEIAEVVERRATLGVFVI